MIANENMQEKKKEKKGNEDVPESQPLTGKLDSCLVTVLIACFGSNVGLQCHLCFPILSQYSTENVLSMELIRSQGYYYIQ